MRRYRKIYGTQEKSRGEEEERSKGRGLCFSSFVFVHLPFFYRSPFSFFPDLFFSPLYFFLSTVEEGGERRIREFNDVSGAGHERFVAFSCLHFLYCHMPCLSILTPTRKSSTSLVSLCPISIQHLSPLQTVNHESFGSSRATGFLRLFPLFFCP